MSRDLQLEIDQVDVDNDICYCVACIGQDLKEFGISAKVELGLITFKTIEDMHLYKLLKK